MKRIAAFVLIGLLGAAGAQSQEAGDWLPPQVERGAAEQLAGRMAAPGAGPEGDARRLERARVVVGALRETLEGWGEAGVLEQAPVFPGLGVPEPEQVHLHAMVRYQVCNLVLALQLQSPELSADPNARLSAILGLSAVTLAIVHLRHPFVAAGGSESEIARLLGGEALEPAFERLQTDSTALNAAVDRCRPMVETLLESSVERLAALADPDG